MRVGGGGGGMPVGPDVAVGPGFPAVSVGRGVCDILLAFMTSVAVGKTVGVGRSVAVAHGEAVAEGCRLGEGNTVAGLLSRLAVTVTVLVAVAIWGVGVADGSAVGVVVAVSLGATTVCWEVAVAPAKGTGVAKGDGQSCLVTMTLAALMPTTITRAIAAWTQDGCQREKPE
jgi:hypothetical protein